MEVVKLKRDCSLIIEHLEMLLTKAREGQLVALATCQEYSDGSTGNWVTWEKDLFRLKLIGEMERQKFLCLKRILEQP